MLLQSSTRSIVIIDTIAYFADIIVEFDLFCHIPDYAGY